MRAAKPNPANTLLVAIMRNEGPYILEWVAHHLAQGFNKIMVFTNDCDDGTDRILDALADQGFVMHLPNPKTVFQQLGAWQVAALRYATTFNAYKDADWVLTIDADEFLEVKVGDGHLIDLFDATDPFDLMSFTVVGYNSCGHRDIIDGSVQRRFTKSIMALDAISAEIPETKSAVKTLMRHPIEGAMFRNHRPKIDDFSKRGMRWVNGSGLPMPDEYTDQKVNTWSSERSLELAQVNHYSIRSQEAFLTKAARGDAMTADRMGLDENQIKNTVTYWKKRNIRLDGENRWPFPVKGAQTLHESFLADPVLKTLHDQALDVHSQKVAAILKTEGGAELAREIGYIP